MRSTRFTSLIVATLLVTLVFTGSGIISAQGPSTVSVALMGQDDIPSLDPSLADDVSGIQVLEMICPV